MTATQDYVMQIEQRLAERVFGIGPIARLLAMTRVAAGHALLEGPPGIGKTLMARTFADALGGNFRRVQGTPDLLPSDITGVTIFKPDGSQFEFRPGPLFADVVLVDEINRAGPKTQSALLEAMEERRVTLDGETRDLPKDFLVIATQNPMDFEGTYPLPESQIDRFLIRLDLSYADRDAEAAVLSRYARPDSAHELPLSAMPQEHTLLNQARDEVSANTVEPALINYVLDICEATRRHQDITLGLSTRAARALLLMARVHAAANGFDFTRPDDVQAIASSVASHRLVLTPESLLAGIDGQQMLEQILSEVAVPRVEAERLNTEAPDSVDAAPLQADTQEDADR